MGECLRQQTGQWCLDEKIIYKGLAALEMSPISCYQGTSTRERTVTLMQGQLQ